VRLQFPSLQLFSLNQNTSSAKPNLVPRSLQLGARKAIIVGTSSVNMKDSGDIPSENKSPLGRNFSKIVTEFADFFISTKHHYSNPLWKMRGWSRIV